MSSLPLADFLLCLKKRIEMGGLSKSRVRCFLAQAGGLLLTSIFPTYVGVNR